MPDPNANTNQTTSVPGDFVNKPPVEASGASFLPDAGLSKPPMEGAPADQPAAGQTTEGEPLENTPKGPKEPVAITVDFVEITLGSLGTIAFQLTSYPGFQFTQKELQTIANLAALCELKAPAQVQLIVGIVALVGGKVGGYVLWKRQGKPPISYDTSGNMTVGQLPPAAGAGAAK